MKKISTYSRIVGDIYDCVAQPSGWESVLGWLNGHFGGLITTMSILDTSTKEAHFAANFGPQHVVEPLVTKYARHMPYFHIIPRMEVDVPIGMETIFGWAGPSGRQMLYGGTLGECWAIPNDVQDGFCLALLKQKSRVGVLVITTTSTRAPVSQAELDELAIIAPHLRRAVTIGNLFETEVSETDTYRDVLNQIATAIFVVSSDMKLRFANPSAEQLLKEGTLLKLINDALMFLTPMVQASIQRAVLLGERSEVALGTLGIGVPTASVNLPAIAYVLPMSNRADAGRIDNGAAATIFVSLPGSDVLPAVEALAGLFGLTPAEKRVTRLVADGKTRAEIAAAHGVSDGTVKSQLDAIYNKTQVKGQRKLQDLVRLLTPPINAKS